jgi:3-dehydroquinate synthase
VGVVTQRSLLPYWDEVKGALGKAGAHPILVEIEDGETARSLQTVEHICDELATAGLLRGDALIALGGGVVGDTGGFAAAVYHRGIDVVQVPTTLLAQVDAAVGGKTAVNLPAGKNLLGAFHQPRAVLADINTLRTLSERAYLAGLGEVAKYAFLPEGEGLEKLLTDGAERVFARDPDVLTEVVTECVTIKATYVESDPEERTGRRAVLNYGHTFAHALEALGGYDLLHGEAVAIGLVFADALAVGLGRKPSEELERHQQLLARLGLPTRVGRGKGLSPDVLIAQMHRDKKAQGGLTFVVPGRNGLERVDDPPSPALHRAFKAVGVEG